MTATFTSEGYDLDALGEGGKDAVLELNGEVTPAAPAETHPIKEPEQTEQSESFKKEGNEYFKAGNYSVAYDSYTEAIIACPGNPTGAELLEMKKEFDEDVLEKRRKKALDRNIDDDDSKQYEPIPEFSPPVHVNRMKLSTYHCNRAACSLYLGQYEEVIDDCTISLMLNSKYTKAFLRRMAAYEKIDDIESALNDAGEALKTDPTNRVARDHVTRLKKKNDERLEKLKEETMGKLKDLGNSILGNFGLSLDNFKAEKDPNTGSYSINFEQKK